MFKISNRTVRQEANHILDPYFQFENRFDFLFVFVMDTPDGFPCLPVWRLGKQRKVSWKCRGFYYVISVGTLYALRICFYSHELTTEQAWVWHNMSC